MKKNRFLWLLLPLALATATGMYFASCNDDSVTDELQPNTETVAPPTDDNISSGDPIVESRVPCSSTECTVTITVNSGTANLTICGTTDGTTACSGTTGCNTVYPSELTTTMTSTPFCVPQGRSFFVRNNDSNSVTITVTVGSSSLQRTIGGSSQRAFGTNFDCDTISDC